MNTTKWAKRVADHACETLGHSTEELWQRVAKGVYTNRCAECGARLDFMVHLNRTSTSFEATFTHTPPCKGRAKAPSKGASNE